MLKKVLLAVSTFGIALLLFVAYQWSDSGFRRPQGNAAPEPAPTTQAATSRGAAALTIRGVEVRPGAAPELTVYDRDGRLKMVFRADEWYPIAANEWKMTRLHVDLNLPGGQPIYVDADEGQVVVAREEGDNYDVKRGRLHGNVHIRIDRTDDSWRKANPDRARPEQHPELIVHLWLDDVDFDLDLARLVSRGDIRVQSPEATVEGTGLELVWNEISRRIDLLAIEHGKRLEFRRETGFAALGMPGVGAESSAPDAAGDTTETPAGTGATGAGAASVDARSSPSPSGRHPNAASAPDADLLADSETAPDGGTAGPSPPNKGTVFLDVTQDRRFRRRRSQIDTYQARFEGGVEVTQKQGVKVVASLAAEQLALLFDFGDTQRQGARVSAPVPADDTTTAPAAPTAPVPPTPPLGPGTTTAPAGEPTVLELVWSGKLSLEPGTIESDDPPGSRLHAIATGRVHMTQGDNSAECDRAEFRNETQSAALTGSPARLRQGETRELTGNTITYNGRDLTAGIDGPGTMMDLRGFDREQVADATGLPGAREAPPANPDEAPRRAVVRWTRRVDLTFARTPRRKLDPRTGQMITVEREYLQKAHFDGNVDMSQADGGLQGDVVELHFGAPESADGSPDRLEGVTATGNVHFNNRETIVQSDSLVVTMAVDDTGRSIPATAKATGNIVARQKDAQIMARDSLLLRLASVPAPPRAIDRDAVIRRVKARGKDPATIDWAALEEKERNRREVAATYLEAFGEVRAADPTENMNLSAEELKCWISKGREIERASLTGTAEQPAEVTRADFFIRGPSILVNIPTAYAEVPAAGLLRFRTDKDLDGQALDEPAVVTVSWSRSMVMNGAQNLGVFTGGVQASSRTNTLDCDELRVLFEDATEDATPATAPAQGDYWIFGPVVRRIEGKPEKPNRNPLGVSVSKRPVQLQATGNARATWKRFDAKDWARMLSRVHIDGPEILVRMDSDQLTVNGEGHLLIEDYRTSQDRPTRKRPADAEARNPFGAGVDLEGPSQTAFTWGNTMSFYARRYLAVFDDDVTMAHRSGSAVLLTDEQKRALRLDVDRMRRMPGRTAGLHCQNLVVEFARDEAARRNNEGGSLAGATELSLLRATDNARLEEGSRSVQGRLITYNRLTGLIRVFGSSDAPATFIDLDENSPSYGVARGLSLTYDFDRGAVEGDSFTISATGR